MSVGHTARLQLWPMPYVSTVYAVRQQLVAKGSTVDELLVGLVTPLGLVDVTSRYRFRAAGFSMVVMPERRMSACLSFGS